MTFITRLLPWQCGICTACTCTVELLSSKVMTWGTLFDSKWWQIIIYTWILMNKWEGLMKKTVTTVTVFVSDTMHINTKRSCTWTLSHRYSIVLCCGQHYWFNCTILHVAHRQRTSWSRSHRSFCWILSHWLYDTPLHLLQMCSCGDGRYKQCISSQ